MFESPGAIIMTAGPFTLRWYGLMIAIGFLLATYAAVQMSKKRGYDTDKIINAAMIGFIGGIIGARLYWVLLNLEGLGYNPLEMIAVWKGGLSIHGGIIGGVIAGLTYCKLVKLPVLECLDIGGAVIPLAQCIGRWGNFFNQEAFGMPITDNAFPLKLYIQPPFRPAQYQTVEFFHPTFLYESFWNLLVFLLLYFVLAPRLKQFPGLTFAIYLGLYSVGRLIIEPMRLDSIMAGPTPVAVIASWGGIIVSLIACLAILALKKKATP
jgi:phosphatidylglycerol:prolipoprotein diacylglycerol transferase